MKFIPIDIFELKIEHYLADFLLLAYEILIRLF